MSILPFRAFGLFFGSIIVGAIIAWQVDVWLGLAIIFFGVLASMYLAVKDTLSELKDTVTLAKNPRQILVASGILTRRIPFWLKPVAFFIFNKLLGRKKREPGARKQVKSRLNNSQADNVAARETGDKPKSYQQ